MRRLNASDERIVRDIAEAHGLGPCGHPDCDPRQPSCATNSIYLRVMSAMREAFKRGSGSVAFVSERKGSR